MSTLPVHVPPRQRPGGVTTASVIAAVLGGLGLVTALWSIAAAFLGMQAQANMFGQAGAMPAEQQAAYREMMADMQSVVEQWKPFTLTVNSLATIASAGLLLGGIGTLRNKPAGRKLLVWFLLASIVTETGWLAMMIPMQMETNTVTHRSMSKLFGAGASPGEPMPKEAKEVTEMIMKASMVFGIAVIAAWVLAKVVFFGFAARYLCRPHVLAHFAPTQAIDVVPLT